MSWLAFLEKVFTAITLFLTYTFGRNRAEESVEAHTNKQALDEANKAIEQRERIRVEADELKKRIPDDWDDVNRLRKTNQG